MHSHLWRLCSVGLMETQPIAYTLAPDAATIMSHYDRHTVCHLSAMAGYYADQAAFAAHQAAGDPSIYEVYGVVRPAVAGELISGVTCLHAGKVGSEYFMTKGHFHAVLDTGEVYYALSGQGMLVLETPEGEGSVQPFNAGQVIYIPPRWAHRTVNTGATDLRFFWVCPAQAGHDYGTIAQQGLRYLVLDEAGIPTVQPNPRWSPR